MVKTRPASPLSRRRVNHMDWLVFRNEAASSRKAFSQRKTSIVSGGGHCSGVAVTRTRLVSTRLGRLRFWFGMFRCPGRNQPPGTRIRLTSTTSETVVRGCGLPAREQLFRPSPPSLVISVPYELVSQRMPNSSVAPEVAQDVQGDHGFPCRERVFFVEYPPGCDRQRECDFYSELPRRPHLRVYFATLYCQGPGFRRCARYAFLSRGETPPADLFPNNGQRPSGETRRNRGTRS
jgi:hypothetical protein